MVQLFVLPGKQRVTDIPELTGRSIGNSVLSLIGSANDL